MKQSWTEGVDWFWVAVVFLTLIVMGFNTIRLNHENEVVKACISAHKTATLNADNKLESCK